MGREDGVGDGGGELSQELLRFEMGIRLETQLSLIVILIRRGEVWMS